jgi:hypothetical protein
MSDIPEDLDEDDEPESWISALIEMRFDATFPENQNRILEYREELSGLSQLELEAKYLRACLVKLHFGKPEYALSETEQREKAAYEDQLSGLTVPELSSRYECADEAAYTNEMIDKHQFCALTPGLRRSYFGDPPDCAYWAALDCWTAGDAASLSIGLNPKFTFHPRIQRAAEDKRGANRSASVDRLRERLQRGGSLKMASILREYVLVTAATEYVTLKERIERAVEVGKLERSITPNDYLLWAHENGISVPDELKVAVEAREPQSNEPRENVTAKERTSLLRMIIGMAIGRYAYDPTKAKNDAPKRIANDLAKVGLSLDDDTIRKWLQQAAELLPQDQNSPKTG